MSNQRILGVLLLVIGLVLLYLGLRATDTVRESIAEGVTGTFTDRTTWYLVGGAAAAIVGGLLSLSGGRVARA